MGIFEDIPNESIDNIVDSYEISKEELVAISNEITRQLDMSELYTAYDILNILTYAAGVYASNENTREMISNNPTLMGPRKAEEILMTLEEIVHFAIEKNLNIGQIR